MLDYLGRQSDMVSSEYPLFLDLDCLIAVWGGSSDQASEGAALEILASQRVNNI